MPYRLGIDLGTTNTVAAVSVDGAPGQPVALGTGRAAMRSALFLSDGRMLIGDDAVERGLVDPSRLLLDPGRRLGTDRTAELGGEPVTPEQATTAVLRFVRDRARAQCGGPAVETVLTHPVGWTPYQLECLDRAAADAELGSVRRIGEAEAAAAAYAGRAGLAVGARVVVYDLGGGSCGAAVLEQTPSGPRMLGAAEGAEHPSGADFDEAVLRFVLGGLGDRGRDLEADDPDSRSRLAQLRQACARAKEELSTETETVVDVPGGGAAPLRLSRRDLESLVRPALRDSAAMITRVLRGADVAVSDLAALVLVGGGCRMPVVAELLGREVAAPVAMTDHPEADVALGALRTGSPVAPVAPRTSGRTRGRGRDHARRRRADTGTDPGAWPRSDTGPRPGT